MNRIIALSCLVFLCIAYSCKSGSDNSALNDVQIHSPEKDFYEFNIRDNLDQDSEFRLGSVANEIRYIPLETNQACLISRCLGVDIFNNNIYVLDTKALYKFDLDGRFIRQIGRNGNGPGEYVSVLWFNFIESTNEIILICYPTGRNNIHDAESGEFKRSFRLDIKSCGVVEFPPGKLAFLTWNTKQPEDSVGGSEIYICNLEGDIVDSIPDERIPFTGNMAEQIRYYVHNTSLNYMGFFQDTLYSLSEDAVKESYASFGLKNRVNANQLEVKMLPGEIQFPDLLYISERVLEDEASFFITVEQGLGFDIPDENLKFYYDKASDQIVNCTSVLNDLDDGIPFWPKSVYEDSVLIDFYPAIEFLDYFQSNPENPDWPVELIELINTLDENDNPIVMLAKQS